MTALTDFDIAGEVQFVRRPRRIPTVWLVAAVLMAGAAALMTIGYLKRSGTMQTTNDAMLQADPVPLVSRMAGRIAKVLVQENGEVNQGGPVVVIDSRDVDARLRAVDGTLSGIRAGISSNRARFAEALGTVEQERAAYRASESEYRYLEGEVARYRQLVARGAEPAERLTKFIADRNRAAAQVAAARAAIAVASARAAGVRTQEDELAARVKIAHADRDAVMIDLDAARVAAPVGGRISALAVQEGQYIQAGQRLGSIVPVDKIYVLANFKETQIARLRPGLTVRVYLDAIPDVTIPGVIDSLAPGTKASSALLPPQNASGNFTRVVQRLPVRIRIKPPAAIRHLLANGLSASVEVDTSSNQRNTARE